VSKPKVHLWIAEKKQVRTGGVAVEEVSDCDGDVVLHGRHGGAGMEHTGAKIGQLPGLVVAETLQAHCLPHLPHPRKPLNVVTAVRRLIGMQITCSALCGHIRDTANV